MYAQEVKTSEGSINGGPELAMDYSQPRGDCDVVMKGGIASGVVYPLALCELATSYRLRSLGGTSAGAIAASLAAAAEYGRDSGTGGFQKLEPVAEWLGQRPGPEKPTNLLALFQPHPKTGALFRYLIELLRAPGGPLRLMRKLGVKGAPVKAIQALVAGCRQFPGAAISGMLPGALLGCAALLSSGPGNLVSLTAGLLLILPGVLLATAWRAWRTLARTLPDCTYYGLSTGLGERDADGQLGLTDWLAELIQHLAGRTTKDAPLTFGDLARHERDGKAMGIDLQLLTTNLNLGRPYRIPFTDCGWYFDPLEFERIFPDYIVDHLVKAARAQPDPDRYPHLLPLPPGENLPIVVGARMSCSFPFLLSAVPLHAVDFAKRVSEDARRPVRTWSLDGGICSNFPVHFFDRPLPTRPTFALNLRPYHPDYPQVAEDEAKNFWLPGKATEGQADWWTYLASDNGSGNLVGFFEAIFDVMQNWRDNALIPVPGFRERIAHVCIAPDEGGAQPGDGASDDQEDGRARAAGDSCPCRALRESERRRSAERGKPPLDPVPELDGRARGNAPIAAPGIPPRL
ncbi:MAG: patatin-like phospholipase family protein, partial [Candidatus Sericytochromatia bacterium]|nr:patatin-like phospholipase family protein [Candidatus Tanganyikabacteria bacterium]